MGFTVIMSSALLACRTVCVFTTSREKSLVLAILLVFGAGMVASWVYGMQDITAVWEKSAASAWNTGACVPVSIKMTYFGKFQSQLLPCYRINELTLMVHTVKYVMTIIFDLLVLCLTTIGILRVDYSSRIGDLLIKHGVVYFILTFYLLISSLQS
jgi:hypothetical protein